MAEHIFSIQSYPFEMTWIINISKNFNHAFLVQVFEGTIFDNITDTCIGVQTIGICLGASAYSYTLYSHMSVVVVHLV